MTKDRCKELIKVMQAYIDGKTIEGKRLTESDVSWRTIVNPEWYDNFEYRIKTQPEYVPFTIADAEKFICKPLYYKGDETRVTSIIKANLVDVTTIDDDFNICQYSYSSIIGIFKFLDGSPCGKLKV